jgi:hypothetical protein
MEMWRDISRRILVKGESKRQICWEYGIHFKTLQKPREHAEQLRQQQSKPRYKKSAHRQRSSKKYSQRDQKALREQRPTAKRIFERLVSEERRKTTVWRP